DFDIISSGEMFLDKIYYAFCKKFKFIDNFCLQQVKIRESRNAPETAHQRILDLNEAIIKFDNELPPIMLCIDEIQKLYEQGTQDDIDNFYTLVRALVRSRNTAN